MGGLEGTRGSKAMKIDQLKYFAVLAQSSSFSEAARKLYITQQGLNKAITAIERELGVKLIDRTYSGIELTAQGKSYLEYAQAIATMHDHAVRDITFPGKEHDASRLSLFTTPYAMTVIDDCLEIKDIRTLRELPYESLIGHARMEAIHTSEENRNASLFVLDAFCEGESLPSPLPDHEFMPLVKTRLGILVRPSSALSKASSITPDAMAELPLAFVQNDTIDDIVERLFRGHRLQDVVLKTSNHHVLLRWANEGRAACVLDSFAFWKSSERRGEDTGLVFVPLETDFTDTTGILWRRNAPNAALLAQMASSIRDRFVAENSAYRGIQPL